MKFTCPKCKCNYNALSTNTIESGICVECRRTINIPYYIPLEQHNKWLKEYKWKI
jgi:transposase-like protein